MHSSGSYCSIAPEGTFSRRVTCAGGLPYSESCLDWAWQGGASFTGVGPVQIECQEHEVAPRLCVRVCIIRTALLQSTPDNLVARNAKPACAPRQTILTQLMCARLIFERDFPEDRRNLYGSRATRRYFGRWIEKDPCACPHRSADSIQLSNVPAVF